MQPAFRYPVSTFRSQSGAALVVALVMLIALTLLGLASMGGNILQQRMAYSIGESNVALQGAESAIAAGEAWIDAQLRQPVPDCVETSPTNCGATTSIWPGRPAVIANKVVTQANVFSNAWWVAQGRPVGWLYQEGTAIAPIAGQAYLIGGVAPAATSANYPRYVIEELGPDPSGTLVRGSGSKAPVLWYYQITGRGNGAISRGEATVTQSVFTRYF